MVISSVNILLLNTGPVRVQFVGHNLTNSHRQTVT